jgi:hypothetical protein
MTTSSGNIDVTRMVVQAYLNITQDITQASVTQQAINIDCSKDTTACAKCLKTAKKYNLGGGDYESVCMSCFCKLENVQMSNNIKINMSSFQSMDSSTEFEKQIQNSLTQQSSTNGGSVFNPKSDNKTTLSDTSKKMFKAIQDSEMQTAIQQLQNFQVLNLNDPNTQLINVRMDLAVDFLSSLFQKTKSTSKILSEYQSHIEQSMVSLIQNSLTIIITWIVTLFIITILVVFFIFGIDIVLDVLTLYAST